MIFISNSNPFAVKECKHDACFIDALNPNLLKYTFEKIHKGVQQVIYPVKVIKTEKKIPHAGNAILKGILEVAKVDPARAKAILDSISLKDIMMINAFSSWE